MYEESGYYDPNPIPALLDGLTQDATSINGTGNILDTTNLIKTSTFSLEEFAHTDHEPNCNAMEGLESLQHHLGFDLEQEIHSHLIHPDMSMPMMSLDNTTSWDQNTHQNLGQLPHYLVNTDVQQQLDHHFPLQPQDPQCYDTMPLANYTTDASAYTSSTPAPDLLNLLHLPRYTVAPPAILPSLQQQAPLLPTDITRNNNCYPLDIFSGGSDVPMGEDGGPMLQMGYHPPPPHHHQNNLLRDLFHSLPQNYGAYIGVDEGEAGGGGGGGGGGISVFQEDMNIGRYDKNPVFDYRREVKVEKGTFATEKQRRVQMNGKYDVLKSMIPNLSKTDRASIVMGAIDYIQELQRTVTELKLLIEKKKYGRGHKRSKIEMSMDPTVITPSSNDIIESSSVIRHVGGDDKVINKDLLFNDTLRSSWLQRESRETFIDVRIVDDEVNLKMTQKKKMNCLLIAVKALDELQLDIVHVSAGFIGERYVFLFNTKILEGSPVYASAIAKKMLEVMEKPYVPSPNNYPSKSTGRVLI